MATYRRSPRPASSATRRTRRAVRPQPTARRKAPSKRKVTARPLTEAQLQTARLYANLDRSRLSAAANRMVDQSIRQGVGITKGGVPSVGQIVRHMVGTIRGMRGTPSDPVPYLAAGTIAQAKNELANLDAARATAQRVTRQKAAVERAKSFFNYGTNPRTGTNTGVLVSRRRGSTIKAPPTYRPSRRTR